MRLIGSAAALAAAAALSACATAERAASAVWPFGGGQNEDVKRKAPMEGRISIMAFEQTLEADPALKDRKPQVPAPSDMPNWSQPGGQADNAPQNIMAGPGLAVAWRRSVGEGSTNAVRLTAPPVAADGRLYVMDAAQTVHALDSGTGRSLWSTALRPEKTKDRNAIGGGVAVAGGRIFATSGYGEMLALDSATGQVAWRTKVNAPFGAAPTVAEGRVFAVTNDSELLAFDAATGTVQWSHQAIAEPARILSASSPAVVGDIVIAPFASGEVIALLAANGRRLWVDALSRAGRATSLSAINDIAGRPAVLDGTVYAASHSGLVAAIDQRSGQRVWWRGLPSTQTPWVAGDAVYAVSVDGELAAMDRTNGQIFWVTQLTRFKDAEDRKGRISWAGPIMAGGKLILAGSNGAAAIVDPETGRMERTFDIGSPVFVAPIAAGGMVYIYADDGRIVALK